MTRAAVEGSAGTAARDGGAPQPTAFLMHPAAVLHDTGLGAPRTPGAAARAGLGGEERHGRAARPGGAGCAGGGRPRRRAPWSTPTTLIDTVRGAVDRRARGARGGSRRSTPTRGFRRRRGRPRWGRPARGSRPCAGWWRGGSATPSWPRAPPGHHATPDRAMGFCLFNNIAVAAAQSPRPRRGRPRPDRRLGRAPRERNPGRLLRGSRPCSSCRCTSSRTTPGTGAANETGAREGGRGSR